MIRAKGVQCYYQLIPEKVLNDFNSIEELIRPKIESFNPDYLKEVISIVATHVRKKKRDDDSEDESEGETAQLKMEYIKNLVPTGNEYLLRLIDLGIIKRSGNYVVGKKSYEYNFAPDYQSIYIRLPLQNAKLISRVKKAQELRRQNPVRSIWGLTNQVKYLKQLTLDPSHEDYLQTNYTSGTDKCNRIIASAVRIENRDIFYSRDDTSNRFHHNVTTMPSGLRTFLRIKGEPLNNLDLKTSQPYFSTLLLTNPTKVKFLTNNPAFIMILKSLKVSHCQDIMNYISLTVLGELYDYLVIEFAKEGLNLNRDKTKKKVLLILFSANPMPRNEVNRKCKQIFKKCFPTVFRIFNKLRGSEKGDHFENFKRFSILLQSIESYLILDIILRRIYKELPGVPAISIHDSIMTTADNVEAVHKIMLDELRAFVGYEPRIEVE